ncbi:MAG: ABC transporter substrate-binding protein, partial [Marmoricola sp.]
MRLKIATGLLGLAMTVTACGATGTTSTVQSTAAPHAGGQLTVALALPPSSLDPIAGTSGGDQMSLYPIFDRLIDFNAKTLEPTPGLASTWSSPTPTSLVLNLRPGVKFQDGTPVDASAVVFSLDRALTTATSVVRPDLASVKSVRATGPLQVTIALKQPDASLVLTLADRAGMVVSPAAVKRWGANFGQHPVGSGPYKFVSYTPNAQLVLAKNTSYWQAGKPYLTGVTFKYITDQQTANNALQSHQVDAILNVPLADESTLKAMSGVTVVSAPSLLTDGCYLNFSRAPFNNVNVRLAVASAIDRASL